MDGVAVKVAEDPKQTVAELIVTVGSGFTTILITLLKAHCPADGVNV